MKKLQGFIAVVLTVAMMLSVTALASQPAGDVAAGDAVFGTDVTVLPRNETLYIGGWQWGTPISGNPYSAVTNCLYVDQAMQSARVMVYETLYMYNILDGNLYPLLANGQPEWNDDVTVLTVRMNLDAKWNDGTRVTAYDVAATFETHVKVGSSWVQLTARPLPQLRHFATVHWNSTQTPTTTTPSVSLNTCRGFTSFKKLTSTANGKNTTATSRHSAPTRGGMLRTPVLTA